MAHKPHAFENQIFQHFRDNAKKINESIKLLVKHNYTIIDLEGQIINKETIEKEIKPAIAPTRYNKRNTE